MEEKYLSLNRKFKQRLGELRLTFNDAICSLLECKCISQADDCVAVPFYMKNHCPEEQ